MYYVEYLRAVRALRIVAIVLALLLVASLLARLSWGQILTPHDTAAEMERSPTAHVTRRALPNGGTRTVIDDPKKGIHAVVERHRGAVTSVVMGAEISASLDRARPRATKPLRLP